MNEIVLTPGQQEEALAFYTERVSFFSTLPVAQQLVFFDAYFYMKNIQHIFKPTEFVVGVEYKDHNKVVNGNEAVNITFFNPHKGNTEDVLSKSVLMHILTTFKNG